MTVQELIDALSDIEDKNILVEDDDCFAINSVSVINDFDDSLLVCVLGRSYQC